MKGEPSRLIPRKLTENLELLFEFALVDRRVGNTVELPCKITPQDRRKSVVVGALSL